MSSPADRMSPMSGKVYGPDGKVYWLTDLLQGAGGGATMQFLYGANDPTSDLGRDGDVYLNTASGDLFKKESGTWALLMNLVGPEGHKESKVLLESKGHKESKDRQVRTVEVSL